MEGKTYSLGARLAAWSVHLFTASGILAGFMGLLAVEAGDWRAAMLWLLLCQFIDGIDGTFARLARVEEVLPYMHGKDIDFVIDFFTYAVLPAYFFYKAVPMPDASWSLIGAFAMLLSGAIYYGKEGMVSEDGSHFVGFPVMWNMFIYFAVFVWPFLPAWLLLGLVFLFVVLHFVPILFAYPSRSSRYRYLTWGVTALFLFSILFNVWIYPEVSAVGRGVSVVGMLYFGGLAAVETVGQGTGGQGTGGRGDEGQGARAR